MSAPKATVWIVGDRGMLGSELRDACGAAGIAWVGSDREVDILDPAALDARFAAHPAEWIVNCAAYTAVDKAEDDIARCRALNADGPGNLADLAARAGASILHLSTDYVFPGTGDRPYAEDDPVAPIGIYGATKAEGEARVRAACPRHVILRTAWLYGPHGPNFVYTMLRLLRVRPEIGVVADQTGSPTYAADLAAAIIAIVSSTRPKFGTYHYTDAGETTWHEFARRILRVGAERGYIDGPRTIKALATSEYPTKASRPQYSVLSKAKIVADYGVKVPAWQDSLDAFFDRISARDLSAYIG